MKMYAAVGECESARLTPLCVNKMCKVQPDEKSTGLLTFVICVVQRKHFSAFAASCFLVCACPLSRLPQCKQVDPHTSYMFNIYRHNILILISPFVIQLFGHLDACAL